MKRLALFCVSLLLVACLLLGCVPKEEGVTPPIDWSEVSIPGIDINTAVFSSDAKTIYSLGSNSHVVLQKSDDGGHSWVTLPAVGELDIQEAFFLAMANDELFIGTTGNGIYRSADSGETFNKLPFIPGVEERTTIACLLDATVDASGKPVVLAGTATSRSLRSFGGLWILSYPYENWVDTGVGNADSGSKYNVWQVAFSPNYTEDKQIVALVSDWQHLRVTFKYGDEAWGERIADAQIPDTETECDLDVAFSNFAFPDDYDSQNPIVFIGTGLYTEHLYQTPQYTDLYRIDGKPAGSGPSVTTDLDVGGKGTSTPVYSVALRGPADSATILAGSVSQVYRSTDGGQSWQGAKKPPTGGAIEWLGFDPRNDESSLVYCVSTDSGSCLVPRGAEVPVGEGAFSCSADSGITWNQVSLMIGTTIDETISHAISPNYANDKIIFMLTCSRGSLTVAIDEDEMVNVTREPNEAGATAEVFITPHQANPPGETMRIGDREYVTGTGPTVLLDDDCPSVTVTVVSALEKPGWLEELKKYYPPKLVEEYLALCEQPRQAVICVFDGEVTVTKGEATKGKISVDGNASDWQGIEPLATDPEGDAPSKDEDMKAFYMTNDNEYLYFMVEFYGENPHSVCESALDVNLDGEKDYSFSVEIHEEEDCERTHVYTGGHPSGDTLIHEGEAALGTVLEGKIPLELIGNPKEFRINWIQIVPCVEEEKPVPDEWEGSFEVEIEELAALELPPIPFPSTESLWKTTDGGNTWERILTSRLKLWVDGEEIQVGPLESIILSDNFAQDNTIFVQESGDAPKLWISTDGGATFAPQK